MKKILTAALLADFMGILLRFLSRRLPGSADRYAEIMNPLLVNTLGRLSGLFPFSIAELLLYLLILTAAAGTLSLFRRRPNRGASHRTGRPARARFRSAGCFLFCLLSALFFLFELNEDVYFSRTGFAARYNLERDSYTTEELETVCRKLVNEINLYAPQVLRNADGHMTTGLPGAADSPHNTFPDSLNSPDSPAQAQAPPAHRVRAAMQRLGETYPELSGWYPLPKPVLFSTLLSRGDITGVYSMFTVEANYNRDMPQYNLPFTMGHELSHLKGFESEKEANFLGYLCCVTSEDPDLRYSAAMMGWVYCGNELHRRDYDAWLRLHEALDPRAREDLEDNNRFWDRYRGKVSETVQDLNDAYLKAEGLKEGTLSYDLVADMIVTWNLQTDPQNSPGSDPQNR